MHVKGLMVAWKMLTVLFNGIDVNEILSVNAELSKQGQWTGLQNCPSWLVALCLLERMDFLFGG